MLVHALQLSAFVSCRVAFKHQYKPDVKRNTKAKNDISALSIAYFSIDQCLLNVTGVILPRDTTNNENVIYFIVAFNYFAVD